MGRRMNEEEKRVRRSRRAEGGGGGVKRVGEELCTVQYRDEHV